MLLLYIHAVLMCTGFLLLMSGFCIARFFKRKVWWLKIHTLCGIVGAASVLTGFFAVVLDISLGGGQHFRIPHSYIGGAGVPLAIVAPILGFMQFKVGKEFMGIKQLHTWSGKTLLFLLLANSMVGFSLIGILS